ncbi:MAG: ABC transporter ATP-binding protein [Calditrichaeota bacterium]|nr:ABC transporter ATP-binding protein [Calditrichota bacterium]RQW07928.1 MAG: ABC transporter ATP-binding protein [Calditrichota bacterium]
MEKIVECKNLTHSYGQKQVLKNLSFTISKGSIFGLLGKNGAGKTTTINILNGYLTPTSGQCLLFGEDSQQLSPQTKARIGYLMEGHIQYSFMNIRQIEKFYSAFYSHWNRDAYYDLMSKLDVAQTQKISRMSCGQRSQVALGLVLAQDPDLMVLDDYSMGLDPGYRRLFIDYLKAYAASEGKTIFVTSHIIQDLDGFIDKCVIIGAGGVLFDASIEKLRTQFRKFQFKISDGLLPLKKNGIITNIEQIRNVVTVYTFQSEKELKGYLKKSDVAFSELSEVEMSLEDAFIGLTGKY